MKKPYRYSTCLAVAALVIGSTASVCFGRVLSVQQKYQEQTQWCWAGCSQAILAYYGTNLSQTEIAQFGTDGADDWNWLYGSSSNPTRRGIDLILSNFDSISSTPYASSLSLADLTSNINAARPPVIRWGWDSGGGHFVVVYGTEGETVYLMDPWLGPTVNSYDWVCIGSSHTWTHTLELDSINPNVPNAPAIMPPTNGTINAFSANWQAVSNATYYWLDVAPTNDFTPYLAGYSNRMVGAMLTISVTGLQAGVAYYYRVRAENATETSTNSATQMVSAPAVGLLPGSLTYTGTYGGSNPVAQTVAVTNWGNRGFDFTNTTTYSAGAAGWWRATPSTGRVDGLMAAAIMGSVSLTGINAGTYYATNAVISVDATNSPQYLVVILTVNKAVQAITNFTPVNGATFAIASTVGLAAQSSSGLPVTNFAVGSGPGVISGLTNLTFTSSGSVNIVASQPGDMNWNAAPNVTNSFSSAAISSSGVCADYDGDGLADPTVYDEATGTWKIKLSSQDYAIITITLNGLGGPGYASVSADYDGDRMADPAVYQESSGVWTILKSSLNYAVWVLPQTLGGAGYSGMPADYDGDRLADPGVYERNQGDWKVLLSSAGYYPVELQDFLGGTGYRAVADDYDGDKLADPAIYGESNGYWIFKLSSMGYVEIALTKTLGGTGYVPVPADYDGDGKADPAVKSETGNEWTAMLSSTGYTPVHVTLQFE